MATQEAGVEADEFASLCARVVRRCGTDAAELQRSMNEVSALHAAQLGAVRQSLGAQLQQVELELARVRALQEDDRAAAAKQLAHVEQDFAQQLAQAMEGHKVEIARVKASYEGQLASAQHTQGLVTQLHADHSRELARVQDAWRRVVGNKEREIARLQRQLSEDAARALEQRAVDAQRCDEADRAVAQLRRELLLLQEAKNDVEARYSDELLRVMEESKRNIDADRKVLNSFQDKTAEIELTFSRLRVLGLRRSVADHDEDYYRRSSTSRGASNGTPAAVNHDTRSEAGGSGASDSADDAESNVDVELNGLNKSGRRSLQEQLASMQARESEERQMRERLLEQAERIKNELSQITTTYRAQISRQVEALQHLGTLSTIDSRAK